MNVENLDDSEKIIQFSQKSDEEKHIENEDVFGDFYDKNTSIDIKD